MSSRSAPTVTIETLNAAAEAGDVAALRQIVNARPDLVDVQHGPFGSALHRAVLSRNEVLTSVLVGWLLDRGALVDARDAECKTPLDMAAFSAGWATPGRDGIFYFMENARTDSARFYETARLLLAKGAELTPRAAVALGDREAVLRLHREGRLKSEIDDWDLLAIAVRVNRLEMVTTLLDLGFDANESVPTGDGDGTRNTGMPL